MDCMSYEPRPGPTLTEQPTSFGLNQTGRADEVRPPRSDEALSAIAFRNERRISVESITLAVIAAMTLAWFGCNHFVTEGPPPFSNAAVKTVVERIIAIESNGDSNAKNKRSSATGVGQFLEETWLEMIGTYRPDLVQGRSQKEILELRRDPELAREIVTRLVEQNATTLKKRALPVTPVLFTWRILPVRREPWPSCQFRKMSTQLHSWRALTRPAGQRVKSSSMQTHSSKSSRSAI